MLKRQPSEYQGYRGAGIRLGEDLLPELRRLAEERTRRLQPALHAFDKAHAVMLVEERLLAREPGAAILTALRAIESDGAEDARMRAGGGLHAGEQYLVRTLGDDVGGRLHLGRSSGDLNSVAINMTQRDCLLSVLGAVNELRRVLVSLARSHTSTIVPGYTFGQHAQPTTLAHVFLSWAFTLARDFDRLRRAASRMDQSAAGAAIMVGTDFALNRERTAELLGFEGVHENAADAVLALTPDDCLDGATAVAVLYHSLARWADDLILWSTAEYAFVDIPDRFCTTSSIMPQKKNVIGPAEIKGAAAEALACVVAFYHGLKGPTGLPITELHHGLDLFWRVADSSVRDLGWYCELLPAMIVRRDRMQEQAGAHWSTAADLASALVRACNMPWRVAHQIVGVMVRQCEERGLGPADVTPELLDAAAIQYHGQKVGLAPDVIRRALDPAVFVNARTLKGGPAPREATRQADVAQRQLDDDARHLAGIRTRIARARERLEAAIDRLIGADVGSAGGAP